MIVGIFILGCMVGCLFGIFLMCLMFIARDHEGEGTP